MRLPLNSVQAHARAFLAFAIWTVLAGATPAFAGAFNVAEGAGDISLTNTYETAFQRFDKNGVARAMPRFQSYQPQLIVNYGFTDWLMLTVKRQDQFIFSAASLGPPAQRGVASSFGTNEVGLQARLWKGESAVVALQGTWRELNFDKSVAFVPVGRAANDFDTRLLAGYTFKLFGLAASIDAQTGYRIRSNAPNEWRGDYSLSIKADDKWRFSLQSLNFLAASSPAPALSKFIPLSQAKVQGNVFYAFASGWAAQFGLFDVYAGSDIRANYGAVLGVTRKF
jgi:hypothetical protein